MRQSEKQLRQYTRQTRGKNPAPRTTNPAENHHQDDIDRLKEIETFRGQISGVMSKQRPGSPSKKGPYHECNHLILCGIDAHGFSSYFIVAHRQETAAVSGVHQAENDVNRDGGKAKSPEDIGISSAHTHAASGAQEVNVQNERANDFAETERHDCQIVTAQS